MLKKIIFYGDMMKTRITDMLGIEYPIFQGGMAWISEYRLAAAVSNSGGLGIIAAANAPAAWLKEQVKAVRKFTDKPFGINVMMLSPYIDDIAKVIIDENVQVITTGAGSPKKYISKWKDAGVKVMPVIASVDMAKKVEALGADAVIAEGCEAGGHIGKMNSMALIPQVADTVSIPVIAAGGIADARGMAAAFVLGASGVQIGTRFICTNECVASKAYKDAIIRAKDTDTIVTGQMLGKPVRILKNQMSESYIKMEQNDASAEKLEELTLGSLKKAAIEGDIVNGSVMAGQSAGMINSEINCRELICELVEGTTRLIGGKKFFQ